MSIKYISIERCREYIFPEIKKNLDSSINKVPEYELERDAIDELDGILVRIQGDTYYPSFYDKASYLYAAIVKGHKFSNGNKRLGWFTLLSFIDINNYKTHKFVESEISKKLLELFPKCDYDPLRSSEDNFQTAIYNIGLTISDKEKIGDPHFDLVKSKIRDFLVYTLYKN